jgi:Tol biopolymer transport system component
MKPGERLGAYEIVGPLGTGGMGDVYKAHDTRLDRDVAIKILLAPLAGDPDAAARFEREALSVARLSHPNILAIYEFGRAPLPGSKQDIAFVVSELIDGDTLRARLADGPLQPRRATAYAQQIARGIAAAHARGIVQRDLKPENVMMTRDDHVKILDFGLAKPISGVAARSVDETRAVNVKTTAGTVLGTFGYMAPEQVRGLEVDHRADIFAFGAVLYEMLSGERAFKGETAADTITAILTKDPPELDLAKLAISPALERIVRRCLEKSPELRFQSANDLAFALENLTTTSTASGAVAQPPPPAAAKGGVAAWLPWSIAGLAVGVAGLMAMQAMKPPRSGDVGWQRFSQLTDAAGEETSPTITPDGGTVAYAMRQNGRWAIFAQRVGGRNAVPIVADADRDLGAPAYSPDGASIAFHEADADGGIFVAGATGESVRRLTDIGFNPAWSPDGRQIAFTTEEVSEPANRTATSALYVVDAAGGTPRKLTGDADAIQPAWSPDGKRIVYWSNTNGQRDLYTISSGGGGRTALTNDAPIDWSPEWSPDGKFVYFSSDRGGAMNVWRLAVDEASGTPKGSPEPITNGVQASAALARLSLKGDRLVFRSRVNAINPVAIPFDPSTWTAGVPRVLDGSNNIRTPSDVSPDGTTLAFFSIGAQQEDIFLSRVDGSGMHRLTDDSPRDRAPMFTHDNSVMFYSTRGGNWAGWKARADGSGLQQMLDLPGGVVYMIPSPLDDRFVFTEAGEGRRAYLVVPGGKPQSLPGAVADGATLMPTSWSSDAQQLAGSIEADSGRYVGIAVYDLARHTMQVVSRDETAAVRFLPDGVHLIYFTAEGSELVLLDTRTRERRVISVQLPGAAYDDVFALSRDGRTIYYGAVRAQSDIWIAEKR